MTTDTDLIAALVPFVMLVAILVIAVVLFKNATYEKDVSSLNCWTFSQDISRNVCR